MQQLIDEDDMISAAIDAMEDNTAVRREELDDAVIEAEIRYDQY